MGAAHLRGVTRQCTPPPPNRVLALGLERWRAVPVISIHEGCHGSHRDWFVGALGKGFIIYWSAERRGVGACGRRAGVFGAAGADRGADPGGKSGQGDCQRNGTSPGDDSNAPRAHLQARQGFDSGRHCSAGRCVCTAVAREARRSSKMITSLLITSKRMNCNRAGGMRMMRPRNGGRTELELVIIAAVAALLMTLLVPRTARADIFQWQWVDPNDHSLGKTQSSVLCPGGVGLTPMPGAFWGARDLTQAYLYQGDLAGSFFSGTTLTNAYFGQVTLSGSLISGTQMSGADLTQTHAPGANFRFTTLVGADFKNADLSNGTFLSCTLSDTSFRGANLSGTFFNSVLGGVDFTDAIIAGADLRGQAGSGARDFTAGQLYSTASYKNKDLRGIRLSFSDLMGWDFSQQDLTDAVFDYSKLHSARFTNATLNNALMFGTELSGADFGSASLRHAGLRGGRLDNANLVGADFSNADLYGAVLTNSDCDGVVFQEARLAGAEFRRAGLRDAELIDADLASANLSASDLRGARNVSFSGAIPPIATNAILPDGI